MTGEDRDTTTEQADELATRERDSERGDVAEPDAPTAGEENEGLSTVLSADPVSGVQKDADDE